VLVVIAQVVVQGWTLLAWGVSNAPPAHRHFEWRWLPVSILPELILRALVVTRFAIGRPLRPLWRPAVGIAFVAALAFLPIARAFDLMPTGAETQHVFVGTAYAHLQPREFADIIEKMGHPRPELPAGLEVIEVLDASAVAELARSQPVVSRVLHLVELMLEGDAQIDWAAAYSALEASSTILATAVSIAARLGGGRVASARTSRRRPTAQRR
jgi:hypothetical protein